jgi:hypothetical protein
MAGHEFSIVLVKAVISSRIQVSNGERQNFASLTGESSYSQ